MDFGGLDVDIDCVQRDGGGVLDDIETMCMLGFEAQVEGES